jgi:hypothetical protein
MLAVHFFSSKFFAFKLSKFPFRETKRRSPQTGASFTPVPSFYGDGQPVLLLSGG